MAWGMMLPMDQARALPNSLSPNDAEDGAVMGRSCVNQLPAAWSILLTLGHPTKYVWGSPMSLLGSKTADLRWSTCFPLYPKQATLLDTADTHKALPDTARRSQARPDRAGLERWMEAGVIFPKLQRLRARLRRDAPRGRRIRRRRRSPRRLRPDLPDG